MVHEQVVVGFECWLLNHTWYHIYRSRRPLGRISAMLQCKKEPTHTLCALCHFDGAVGSLLLDVNGGLVVTRRTATDVELCAMNSLSLD